MEYRSEWLKAHMLSTETPQAPIPVASSKIKRPLTVHRNTANPYQVVGKNVIGYSSVTMYSVLTMYQTLEQ